MVALALAVGGGVINAGAFPGLGWWPLIFLGTPMILAATIGHRFWRSLLVGTVAGFAFWGTHILWITVYLGPAPWLALAGLQAVFFGLGLTLVTVVWRVGDRALTGRLSRLAIVPVVVAGLWTLREYITSNWPYGGFSWGRLAFSQSESPFGSLVAWVGISGLTFAIALVSALIVQVARGWRVGSTSPLPSLPGRRRMVPALVPCVLLALLALVPAFPLVESGSIRIAAVQGNADAGLFSAYTPGEILQDHFAATEPIFGQKVDLVVWPENATDIDPLLYGQSASVLDRVTAQMHAPLITGTITTDGDKVFNSLLLWKSGEGAVAQYDKLHPVPFAEYIPDRAFWYPLAPDLLKLIPRDYTVGSRPNVFDIHGVKAGLAICFDIVDDNLIRQMIAGGAELIVAPTNNADFGHTDENLQQLAIARLRSIETGRSLVNTSTVGTSAIIGPDGRTIDRLATFQPGTMVRNVPLSTTTTLSTLIGESLELVLSALGLVGLLALVVVARKRALRTV